MGEIRVIKGSIFNSDCEAIVNTVNCKGVMGKGLALEFKYRYPQMFLDYKLRAERGEIKIGKLTVWSEENIKIINFPTKVDWKYPSKMDYIRDGLNFFKSHYKSWGINSVAFPGLGTDQGGLNFQEVVSLIKSYLCDEEIRIEIYEYDPSSKDSIFEKLIKKIENWGLDDFKREGILKNQAIKISEGLKSGEINNFTKIAAIKGLGESTLTRLYSLAKKNSNTPQKKLF